MIVWQKTLLIIILFYLFALLQNAFFVHFRIFGASPNLVFIFFFLLIFFSVKASGYFIVFLASLAGFFLGIYSVSYIGLSIIFLIIIGSAVNAARSVLKNLNDSRPFVYFLPLFASSLFLYEFLSRLLLFFLNLSPFPFGFGKYDVFLFAYNLVFGTAAFIIYKKIINKFGDKISLLD